MKEVLRRDEEAQTGAAPPSTPPSTERTREPAVLRNIWFQLGLMNKLIEELITQNVNKEKKVRNICMF